MKIAMALMLVISAAYAYQQDAPNASISWDGNVYRVTNTITPVSGGNTLYIVESATAIGKAEETAVNLTALLRATQKETLLARESVKLLDVAKGQLTDAIAGFKIRQSLLEDMKQVNTKELGYAKSQTNKILLPPWAFYALLFAFACIITLPMWKKLIYSPEKGKRNDIETINNSASEINGANDNVQPR